MAFGLAVYASWSELPQYHAKLASSCWSGSTERDSHPQGSDERFQSCKLHLIPPSQAYLAQVHQPQRVRLRPNSLRSFPPPAVRASESCSPTDGAGGLVAIGEGRSLWLTTNRPVKKLRGTKCLRTKRPVRAGAFRLRAHDDSTEGDCA